MVKTFGYLVLVYLSEIGEFFNADINGIKKKQLTYLLHPKVLLGHRLDPQRSEHQPCQPKKSVQLRLVSKHSSALKNALMPLLKDFQFAAIIYTSL